MTNYLSKFFKFEHKQEPIEDKEPKVIHFNFMMTQSLYERLNEESTKSRKSKGAIINEALLLYLD